MIKCPKCEKENIDGAMFCSFCGEKIEVVESDSETADVHTKEIVDNKNNLRIILISVAFVFAILIAIPIFNNSNDADYLDANSEDSYLEDLDDTYSVDTTSKYNDSVNMDYYLDNNNEKVYLDDSDDAQVVTTTKITTTKPLTSTTVAKTKPTVVTTQPAPEPTNTPYNPSAVNNWSASGTGDYVADGLVVQHCGALSITHDGSDYFCVKAHNNETGDYELLVNDVGPYSGIVLIPESGNYNVEVKSESNWYIQALSIGTTDGATFTGHGDTVTSVFFTDNQKWKITNYNSDGYFCVKVYYTENEGDYDLLVNTTDAYSGVVRSDSSGSMFFEILSDGDWSIAPAN